MALPPKQDQATQFPWNISAGDLSVENLYQLFKSRLIEELRTETVENKYGQHSFLRLIDTTEPT